jgi:putative Holliday junction resolvase
MAFDYGTRRIGVAIGQTVSRTATPVKVLQARNGTPQWPEVAQLINEWLPDLFVVGSPRYEDGETHRLKADIGRFARRLRGRYRLPTAFVDERLSSYAARHIPGSTGDHVDAVAATMILETWFESSGTVLKNVTRAPAGEESHNEQRDISER